MARSDTNTMNQTLNTQNNTMDFNETINTTSREQMEAYVEDRAAILERMDSFPIVIAISQSRKSQFHFEEVFRS